RLVILPADHSAMSRSPGAVPRRRRDRRSRLRVWQLLGPGLITGASDDDPSGIATYSQVGAQFGHGMNWVMLFSFPLMAAIQEIMGPFVLPHALALMGWLATAVMAVIAAAMFLTWNRQG